MIFFFGISNEAIYILSGMGELVAFSSTKLCFNENELVFYFRMIKILQSHILRKFLDAFLSIVFSSIDLSCRYRIKNLGKKWPMEKRPKEKMSDGKNGRRIKRSLPFSPDCFFLC